MWCCGPCHTSPVLPTLQHHPQKLPASLRLFTATLLAIWLLALASLSSPIFTATRLSPDWLTFHWRSKRVICELPPNDHNLQSCHGLLLPELCPWALLTHGVGWAAFLPWLLGKDTSGMSSKLTGSVAGSCASRPWVWLWWSLWVLPLSSFPYLLYSYQISLYWNLFPFPNLSSRKLYLSFWDSYRLTQGGQPIASSS